MSQLITNLLGVAVFNSENKYAGKICAIYLGEYSMLTAIVVLDNDDSTIKITLPSSQWKIKHDH